MPIRSMMPAMMLTGTVAAGTRERLQDALVWETPVMIEITGSAALYSLGAAASLPPLHSGGHGVDACAGRGDRGAAGRHRGMTDAWAPAPFRIAFDNARDPYTARNALGITGTGGGTPGHRARRPDRTSWADRPLAAPGTGFPTTAWTAYTPALAAGAGTLTSAAATGRFIQAGKAVFFSIRIAITTNGTAASFITATLPVTAFAASQVLSGYHEINTEVMSAVILSGTPSVVTVRNSAGEYPGANGAAFVISGTYEAA